MNTYTEVIDFLYNQLPMFQNSGPGAYKPGLGTAHLLDDAFSNPHTQYKTVHVAGTNGKGSVCHTIASVLQAQGYRVGLYTSPHIRDFRERIRVNGDMISEEEVIDFVSRYRRMNLPCNPSFFELTTIMAFEHFARHNVEIAVIETGLGGRLDTTNIITPVLSVITNISLDHTSLLGNTEEEISREKAGIIKPHVPVVIGEANNRTRPVFELAAMQADSPIIFAQDNPVARSGNFYGIDPGQEPNVRFSLTGEYQHANANTVMAAIRLLRKSMEISDDAIRSGFGSVEASTGLSGRWQTVMTTPVTVICDTGHNIGAWRILGPKLSRISEKSHIRMVIGFVNDKDVDHIFDLLPSEASYYFVTPSVARGRNASELLDLAISKGLTNCQAYNTVAEGYTAALADATPSDLIYIGGSTFVVADFMNYLYTL